MTPDVSIRKATPDDVTTAYAMFRRSLFDYLFRVGLVDEATAKDPPIASGWLRHAAWIEHLWATSAENWVAVASDGSLVGWALSILRDGHLELAIFFVGPGTQGHGIGRALIERVFPDGRAAHKSIVATQDASALSLYLRSGVSYVTTSVDILLSPRQVQPATDLTFSRAALNDADVACITDLERQVLGFERPADIRFLLGTRPAWLASRGGAPVGFVFGVEPVPPGATDFVAVCGPMAALDPADMPTLIDQTLNTAAEGGDFAITVPFSNATAISHCLVRGGRIDPFYTKILASAPSMQLDRYIHTSPAFIL